MLGGLKRRHTLPISVSECVLSHFRRARNDGMSITEKKSLAKEGGATKGGAIIMSSRSLLGAAFWLGFDSAERGLENLVKQAVDSWPPYNVEQIGKDRLQVTLAVAGFAASELQITLDQNRLTIQGKKTDDASDSPDIERVFLHRGIATRQFQRHFMLGHDIMLDGAQLGQGLLTISLSRPPRTMPRQIDIFVASMSGDMETNRMETEGAERGGQNAEKSLPMTIVKIR